jgi:hypothetical protein
VADPSVVAVVFAFAEYQAMLDFSLRDDPARAQLVMTSSGVANRRTADQK